MKVFKLMVLSVIPYSLVACSTSYEKVNETFCYQKIVGTAASQDTEVLWLKFDTDSGRVSGQYHWLPAFKDKRVGEFTGVLTQLNTANVEYHFLQEGIEASIRLALTFDKNSITIQGGEPSIGLNTTLPSIDCTQANQLQGRD